LQGSAGFSRSRVILDVIFFLVLFSKQNIVYAILRHEACDIKTLLAATSNSAENIDTSKLCSPSSREPNFTGL
jgi:hypothetical protein